MAVLARPCGCAGTQPTIIVFDDGSAPPTVGNVVTLPNPAGERPWAGIAGNGIRVHQPDPDDWNGYQPTISVRVSASSPVPVGFDAGGRLRVGPVDVSNLQSSLVINSGTPLQGGLQVGQGGVKGHAVTMAVAPSDESSSRVFIGVDGGLAVDPPFPFKWEIDNQGGNTYEVLLRNTLTDETISLGTA